MLTYDTVFDDKFLPGFVLSLDASEVTSYYQVRELLNRFVYTPVKWAPAPPFALIKFCSEVPTTRTGDSFSFYLSVVAIRSDTGLRVYRF